MNIWPFKKPDRPEARVHRPSIAGGKQIAADVRHASALKRRATTQHAGDQSAKRGMWVRYHDRTGILTNIEPGDVATVMLVDMDKGENVLEVHVPCADLRQAHYEELPIARRPTEYEAAKFGYLRGPQ